MDKNKRLAVWLPVIIALSVALGIFVGNHYLRLTQGKRHIYSSGNKINAILDIIDEQYVDTVNICLLYTSPSPRDS
mgnify:CR=1 FL=1